MDDRLAMEEYALSDADGEHYGPEYDAWLDSLEVPVNTDIMTSQELEQADTFHIGLLGIRRAVALEELEEATEPSEAELTIDAMGGYPR